MCLPLRSEAHNSKSRQEVFRRRLHEREFRPKAFQRFVSTVSASSFPTKMDSSVLCSGAESKSTEKLDHHYALAVANELFPHVLICFESIFNTTSNSFVNKVRKFRTQMAHKAASTSSSSSSPSYLISSPHEAKELLGSHLFSKLELHCWSVLKDAGFVLHHVEAAAHAG